MNRLVPQPPRLTRIHRRLATLPAGSPTGIACGSAGFACLIGLLVIGPVVGLRAPYHDHHAIAAQGEVRAAPADPAKPAATGKPGRAIIQVAVAVIARPTERGNDPATPDAAPSAPAAAPIDSPAGPTAAPTPRFERDPTSVPAPTAQPSRAPERTSGPSSSVQPRRAPGDDDRDRQEDVAHHRITRDDDPPPRG